MMRDRKDLPRRAILAALTPWPYDSRIAVPRMSMITRLPVAAEAGQVTLLLAPNRALSRRQMRQLTWELCIAALLVAGFAAWGGDVFAPLFALIEIPVLAAALWLVWRSGDRRERITLDTDQVRVERLPPKGRATSTFPVAWTRVRVLDRGDGHRHVVLAAQGREQEVGECLGDDERMQLSRWLSSLLSGRSGWRES
ncbi:MAG: DUF2244 domain-containing protein [Rhodanobacteraceae bacterium]|nr:MAG: DUF2244 domain-containing protein [Rhodanobacteraceae bacterium]